MFRDVQRDVPAKINSDYGQPTIMEPTSRSCGLDEQI